MKQLVRILPLIFLSVSLHASDGYTRFRNIDILHYEFDIKLNDTTDIIEGNAFITFRVSGKCDSLILDLYASDSQGNGMNVLSVTSRGKDIGWKQGSSKLGIVLGDRIASSDTLEFMIRYRGKPKDGLIISRNKYGDRTFFADHWPDRAHNYLPCIDHPYDKATVEFIITAPEKYNVVANGNLVEQSSIQGNMKMTRWNENVPIPVKVMTFGVARFAVENSGDYQGITGMGMGLSAEQK